MPEAPSNQAAPRSPQTNVRVDAWTFDVGDAGRTVESFAETAIHRVETAWDGGVDIVLMPEYLWAGLEPCLPPGADMENIAKVVWIDLMPKLKQRLSRKGKHVVLGTAPWLDPVNNHLHNRALIFSDGRVLHQDKLFLTPWETEFRAGRELYVFEMAGLRVAVVICLDIEIPEISSRLRGLNIDLLLVPTATETSYGSERVNRCASARAVELGCAVIVCPLVGKCDASMVPLNLGKLALYLPAQEAFDSLQRTEATKLIQSGWHLLSTSIPEALIREARQHRHETNPSQLSVNLNPDDIQLEDIARKTAQAASRRKRL